MTIDDYKDFVKCVPNHFTDYIDDSKDIVKCTPDHFTYYIDDFRNIVIRVPNYFTYYIIDKENNECLLSSVKIDFAIGYVAFSYSNCLASASIDFHSILSCAKPFYHLFIEADGHTQHEIKNILVDFKLNKVLIAFD